jgi:hypothetical protein
LNPHQIARLFPNASKSVLAANAADYGESQPCPDLDSRNGSSVPECPDDQALALVRPAQEAVEGRIIVRITVRKCRALQDADNTMVKPLVDQLRYGGIIPEDNPGVIKLEVEQVRVKTKGEEGTEVIVIWPPGH